MGRPIFAEASAAVDGAYVIGHQLTNLGAVDWVELTRALRSIDRTEVRAMTGLSSYEGVYYSAACSDLARWIVYDQDSRPVAIGGAASLKGDIGSPWVLLSDSALTVHRRAFVRRSRQLLARILPMRNVWINWVHADNHVAHRWLHSLGFVVTDLELRMRDEPFRAFYLRCAPQLQ